MDGGVDSCLTGQVCATVGNDGPSNFDNIGYGLMSIFQAISLDEQYVVMLRAMQGEPELVAASFIFFLLATFFCRSCLRMPLPCTLKILDLNPQLGPRCLSLVIIDTLPLHATRFVLFNVCVAIITATFQRVSREVTDTPHQLSLSWGIVLFGGLISYTIESTCITFARRDSSMTDNASASGGQIVLGKLACTLNCALR